MKIKIFITNRTIIINAPKKKFFFARCKAARLIKKNNSSNRIYVVGKPKRVLLKKFTVLEELKKNTGSIDAAIKYANDRKLSNGRINRSVDRLSAERWRAGVAIGLVAKAQNFLFVGLSKEYYKKYKDIFFMDLFNDIWESNGKVIIISEDLEKL